MILHQGTSRVAEESADRISLHDFNRIPVAGIVCQAALSPEEIDVVMHNEENGRAKYYFRILRAYRSSRHREGDIDDIVHTFFQVFIDNGCFHLGLHQSQHGNGYVGSTHNKFTDGVIPNTSPKYVSVHSASSLMEISHRQLQIFDWQEHRQESWKHITHIPPRSFQFKFATKPWVPKRSVSDEDIGLINDKIEQDGWNSSGCLAKSREGQSTPESIAARSSAPTPSSIHLPTHGKKINMMSF